MTNDKELADKAKHLSTTANITHAYEFAHDEVGYNYRMPNLNAAVACAQLEQLQLILNNKRELADIYCNYFSANGRISFVREIENARANYWLNTILLEDKQARDTFLQESNGNKVMTRPIWQLMNKLPMYKDCMHGALDNALWLEERVVNIPSSYRTYNYATQHNDHSTAVHKQV